MADIFADLVGVLSAIWSVVTATCNTIVNTPLLLVPFLLMIISFGVGMVARLKNRVA